MPVESTMKPVVSVIVPVYRDWRLLESCLQSLAKQSYPADHLEVIVVNNDPEDGCPYELPASNMRVVVEAVKSSYAARNRGIRVAKGSILAFTDADCQPDSQWIEHGVNCLQSNKTSMVGGLIHFVFNNPDAASEMLDAVTHMDNQRSIERYKAAVTANLFVKRQVFDAVGLFNENLQSGGDITFTQRVHAAGFGITYCQEAKVNHPTRDLKQGLKKLSRVAGGQERFLRQMPGGWWKKSQLMILHLIPLANPFRVWSNMRRYGNGSALLFVRVMLLSILMGLAYDVFLLKSLLFSIRR